MKYKSILASLFLITSFFIFTSKTYSAPTIVNTENLNTSVPEEGVDEDIEDIGDIEDIEDIGEMTDQPIVEIDKNSIKAGEIASCFDYYSFGGVDVSPTLNFSSYISGDSVMIGGKVKNNNNYPIIDVDVKARLVKNIPKPVYGRAEIMILEEFDVLSGITLQGNGEINIQYNHLLPINAPSGEYDLYFYVVEKDRFNLSGLSFTNDIVAAKVNFSVKGTNPDYIYLDQTKIKVGDQLHNIMGFLTNHGPDEDIPVSIPVHNPESVDKEMKITYTLYSWDSANLKNKIYEISEKITVPAKSDYVLNHVVKETNFPVYYLSIKSESAKNIKKSSVFNETTFSNIRFSRDGKSYPRINFLGVDKYPLKKGVESTLVTCFHNTNEFADQDITKIETVVLDKNNEELSRTLFEGKFISEITGLIQKFTPKKDFSEFTVLSKMYNTAGEEIDSVEKIYKCEDINPELCLKDKSGFYKAIYIIIAICIVFIISFMKIKKYIKIKKQS